MRQASRTGKETKKWKQNIERIEIKERKIKKELIKYRK